MIKHIITALVLMGLLSACQTRREGPLERAGARADEIRDNAEEGKPLLHRKGPMEKAGEAVDDAFDDRDEDD